MFIFREEYYLERSEPIRRADEADERFIERYERWKNRLQEVAGIAELFIAKQRHGPIGGLKLQFTSETTKFSTLDSHHGGEDAPN